jgi:co-chaperonin GroES (HSP10)
MIPRQRLLIKPDTLTPTATGGILLPIAFSRKINTGIVVESGVSDIPINSHVAWDDTLPSIPIIEIEGKSYISMHRNDIKLVNTHQTPTEK